MKNMSTFNSADIAAFTGGVWVFCEQRQGKMMSTSYELISEGRKLADERGTKLYGLLLGDGIEGIAQELGGYGADGVYVCDHPLLKEYTTDAYTKVICDVVEEFKPEVLLIGATNIGRDLGPRCAARLHTGLTADCTHLDVDMDTYVDFLRNSPLFRFRLIFLHVLFFLPSFCTALGDAIDFEEISVPNVTYFIFFLSSPCSMTANLQFFRKVQGFF